MGICPRFSVVETSFPSFFVVLEGEYLGVFGGNLRKLILAVYGELRSLTSKTPFYGILDLLRNFGRPFSEVVGRWAIMFLLLK